MKKSKYQQELEKEPFYNIKDEEFVEKVYNKKRLHSSIGYVPPEEFEEKVLKLA